MGWLSVLTVDRWIALVSSVGTCLASVIAVLNVRELRLQRAQQFQPRIMPIKSRYKAAVDVDRGLMADFDAGASVSLINAGHGVAADISLQWIVPASKWIEKVNILSAQRGAGIGFVENDFGIGILFNGVERGGVRSPDQEGASLPYIVPVSTNPKPTEIRLPGSVIALVHG